MPRKVRDLLRDLRQAGFSQVSGGGKGSHRKFQHPRLRRRVTLSGPEGGDAKPYQEIDIKKAIEEVS